MRQSSQSQHHWHTQMAPFVSSKPLILLGGTFDPVHIGHLWLADAVHHTLPEAQLNFLPTAQSPFKSRQSSARHRLAMLRLALRDTPYGIERLEILQSQVCYTQDTLQVLRRRIGPTRPLIFVLGRDAFDSLPRWKGGYALLELAHLWVFARPDDVALPRVDASPTLSQAIHQSLVPRLVPMAAAVDAPMALPDFLQDRQAQTPQALTQSHAGLIWLDPRQPPTVSSTKIRQHLATSRPLLPHAVYRYTRQSKLYGI